MDITLTLVMLWLMWLHCLSLDNEFFTLLGLKLLYTGFEDLLGSRVPGFDDLLTLRFSHLSLSGQLLRSTRFDSLLSNRCGDWDRCLDLCADASRYELGTLRELDLLISYGRDLLRTPIRLFGDVRVQHDLRTVDVADVRLRPRLLYRDLLLLLECDHFLLIFFHVKHIVVQEVALIPL